ncbi:DUF3137 domain-containing protein [Nocardioides sp.]|uniref:DUF3137 domain-containing protein n=1 Tax=Nocardioides sp. TaxID=35761 RepID=UPI002732965F|nr:DUF3137 domain-containing protein [Nocardioides sp.]MDP3892477.1 DUF3137 domain-containing protein [Nocardioides sp.]
MSTGVVVLLFGGFVCLMIVVGVLGLLAERRRRDEFAALGAQHGWGYLQRDDQWGRSFTGRPFNQGHNRQSRHVLTGEHDGRPFVAFDFIYHTTERSTNSQGHTTTREVAHPYSVVALRSDTPLPALAVTPEGFFGRLAGRLTNRDIELESENFNRAFTVTCADRKFAFDVLHPRLMEKLLTYRDLSFRFERHWLLAIHQGKHTAADLMRRVGALDLVLDEIPDFVWRERRAGETA